jgi:hypothetical protein
VHHDRFGYERQVVAREQHLPRPGYVLGDWCFGKRMRVEYLAADAGADVVEGAVPHPLEGTHRPKAIALSTWATTGRRELPAQWA